MVFQLEQVVHGATLITKRRANKKPLIMAVINGKKDLTVFTL